MHPDSHLLGMVGSDEHHLVKLVFRILYIEVAGYDMVTQQGYQDSHFI
jgi:hypothetical protein